MMNEVLFLSKAGALTVSAGNIALHSSYDPEKEAERYINSIIIKNDVTHFILLEPALSYTIPVLRKKNPCAKMIALRCSSFFCGKQNPDAEWFPEKKESLQSFLEQHIDDADISHIHIIEWQPSCNAYTDAYASIIKEVSVFLKRCAANLRTVKAFGPRWIKNCFKNIAGLQNILTFTKGSCSVLVCGAGPGLETSINTIKDFQHKENLFIIAVSSSFLALKTYGIIPDIVIGSDGGNWAKLHLIEHERKQSPLPHNFLCASLNAALPSQSFEHPILMMSDGSTWQSELLKYFSIPHVQFPQRGTVTAAALDLAFCLTIGNVFVSGIDLSHNDLHTHARPYAFDILLSAKANRYNPYYSQTFLRKEKENPEALQIYAGWFTQYITNYSGRLFSLGKNHALFPQCPQENSSLVPQENSLPQFSLITLKKNNNDVLNILFNMMNNTEKGRRIKDELKELLSISAHNGDEDSALKEKLAALWDKER